MLKHHGTNTLMYLQDAAEIAAGIGDTESVLAWQDIAAAAGRIRQLATTDHSELRPFVTAL